MEPQKEETSGADLACIVLSLRCTPEVVEAVRSLEGQSPRPEIVVVNSGGGDPAPLLRAADLKARVINRRERLLPGAARNVGIAATSEPYVAFLAADCRAEPGWVASRLRAHRAGAKAVASVMTNAFPGSLVASAAYVRTHLQRMPDTPASERLLYSVSYDRMLFERFGQFREDLREGEDTDFNTRIRGEVEIAWVPEVRTAHANPTRLRDLLRDQYARGKRSRVYDGLNAAARLHVTLVKEPRRALAQARRAGDPHERRRLLASWPLVSVASLAFCAGLVVARRAPTKTEASLPRATTAEPRAIAGGSAERSPVASVVVAAYNSRERIHYALDSLRSQDFRQSYEVIVVDSGSDGCADFVAAAYPEVRVVRSAQRLYPGAARNAGVRAARGRYIAFLPDDCTARPDWLRLRIAKHEQGFEVVGGAITNGTPFHPIGSADYYLEYSAQIPSNRILAEQEIPHMISCERALFDRIGFYPEHCLTGEDTIFGARLRSAGVTVGFDANVQIAHRNLTRLGPYLRHQYEHGRGLARVFADATSGMWSPRLAPHQEPLLTAARRIFLVYPRRRWWTSLTRIARGRARSAPAYLLLTPLIFGGLYATAWGQWTEWRAIRSSTDAAEKRGRLASDK